MKYLIFREKGNVGTIILNNPKKLNALNYDMAVELDALLDKIAKSDLRVVIIRGNGNSFCSGGDISFEAELARIPKKEARRKLSFMQDTLARLELLPQVVIAVIHGYAVGGGSELAMASDIRIGLPSSVFSHPEVALGLVPPLGGTRRLARLVGIGRAKYLLFTAQKIGARRALEWGLLDFVVPGKKLEVFLRQMVTSIGSYSPKAIALTKKLMTDAFHDDLIDKKEIDGYFACSGTAYNRAAFERFLRKKK